MKWKTLRGKLEKKRKLKGEGGSWVFSKLQGLQYYFPENFGCNLTYYESKNFSDFYLHHILILEFENFRFSFLYEK